MVIKLRIEIPIEREMITIEKLHHMAKNKWISSLLLGAIFSFLAFYSFVKPNTAHTAVDTVKSSFMTQINQIKSQYPKESTFHEYITEYSKTDPVILDDIMRDVHTEQSAIKNFNDLKSQQRKQELKTISDAILVVSLSHSFQSL